MDVQQNERADHNELPENSMLSLIHANVARMRRITSPGTKHQALYDSLRNSFGLFCSSFFGKGREGGGAGVYRRTLSHLDVINYRTSTDRQKTWSWSLSIT